jgi:hypothetical protein
LRFFFAEKLKKNLLYFSPEPPSSNTLSTYGVGGWE